MNTCACCGQNLKLDGRPIVKVDDALLSLCNEAYANVEARGAGEVSIADLTWCIARSVQWSRDIERAGASPEGLVRSAEMQIARGTRTAQGGFVRTSGDLKTILVRAERRALENGGVAAGPPDFLHVLFRQADDLAGAGFVHNTFTTTSARESGPRVWESAEATAPNRFSDLRREATRRSTDRFARSGEAQIEVLSDRLAREERLNAELRLTLETLIDQTGAMTSRMARIDDWERRLEAQERQIGELQRLTDTLAHQSATATARLAQAIDVGRANDELLAEMERRLRESEIERSRRGKQRPRLGSARSRLRRARRRTLRLRLRTRWRARVRSQRAWDQRRALHRSGRVEAQQTTRRLAQTAPTVRPVTHQGLFADPLEALPHPFLESVPPIPQTATAKLLDLEEEIAEPIEEEDDFGLESALGERPKRFYLALADHVERAPSIGPRTAERLSAVGVATVRDLLASDPQVVASRVASRYVSAERVAAWKSQARLVCTVPWLRGTHAQLLVGAGYDTLEKLQHANTSDVCAGILQFAGTRDGQSVLRSGAPPAPERIALWMGHVTLAEPERGRLAA
ncbi:MAG: DUF4332 domain-containing protein [Hyphomicrobiaceae bacterium]